MHELLLGIVRTRTGVYRAGFAEWIVRDRRCVGGNYPGKRTGGKNHPATESPRGTASSTFRETGPAATRAHAFSFLILAIISVRRRERCNYGEGL